MEIRIPRVVIAATQSGSGKTTLVTGILAALRERGLRVQAYKIGPDYIDPGYHALASGRPAHNLDTWLVPEDRLREIFVRTAQDADIAVIEGVMGLYDGGRKGVSSTAQVAKLLDAPVLLTIDAKSMGASAAAMALGFREYDRDLRLAGVLLNRLGSATHEKMIAEALSALDIAVYGAVRRDEGLQMPERHLGLLPTTENEERGIVTKIAKAVAAQVDLDGILNLAKNAEPVDFTGGQGRKAAAGKSSCRIAVARDEAFSFYYPESLQVLEQCGAEIVTFSPLRDEELPKAEGLILGGGFPEMFAERLSRNASMRASIREAAEQGMPMYAECGGFMYLMRELVDFEGKRYPMAGVFPACAQMQKKLQMVGYVEAELLQDTVLGSRGTRFRGHEFHFSTEQADDASVEARAFAFTRMRNHARYAAGYAAKNVLGSYLHLHFAGCPKAAKHFVEMCRGKACLKPMDESW
ncbi:MAG: cobyrinate a,c-diamide synthase [Selenomonadaceae bacterium]|nr:cobyrinate a,c-diamide synthase [Selenomonadaceae bacterium]